jgi:predicted Zn-dependent protease
MNRLLARFGRACRARLLRLSAALLLAATAAWGQQSALSGGTEEPELPDIGNSARAVLSPERERILGEAFMRSIRRSLRFVEDPLVESYIQSIGSRLASYSDNRERRFSFFVVDSPQINAFAGPGGYIGINSGLILATETESELAAVMAHEIAHVTQGHIARSVEMSDTMSVPTIAAMLASLVLATQSSEAGQAALMASLAGSAQTQIDFIRRNEKEADRVGIRTLARSGFDPLSMPGFFQKLQEASRYNISTAPEFLRTHPVTRSRIADSMNRAERYPYRQVEDSLDFQLMRARLRALASKDPRAVAERFAEALKLGQYRSRDAVRYGLALSLTELGRTAQARSQLQALLKEHPDYIAFLLAEADLEERDGKGAEADAVLRGALDLYPGNYALSVAYARLLLRRDRAAQARDLLREYLRDQPARPLLYQLLAQAEEAVGDSVAAHEALAEYRYLMGDTQGAIDQLEMTERGPERNFYQASRIEARLDELKEIAEEETDL